MTTTDVTTARLAPEAADPQPVLRTANPSFGIPLHRAGFKAYLIARPPVTADLWVPALPGPSRTAPRPRNMSDSNMRFYR
jgi:hypothetical protein